MRSRWIHRLGPGIALIGLLGLVASATATTGTSLSTWVPRACDGPPRDRIPAARDQQAPDLEARGQRPWFRLDPLVGTDGALDGQRLIVGLVADRAARTLDLDPESFAAGPFGRVVLAGSDDGTRSRLLLVDVVAACTASVADESAVVRRATITPDGTAIVETRVDRASRADLGTWRRPIDGSGPARRIVAPFPADERFGRTFSTELAWNATGDRLAIQACGETSCRTRIVDPDGRHPRAVDDVSLGVMIGHDGDRLLTYRPCRGFPCDVVSIAADGSRAVIAPAAWSATLVEDESVTRLVHEIWTGTRFALRGVRPDGSDARDLGDLPEGLRLAAPTSLSGVGTRQPDGWAVLAPEGRMPLTAAEPAPLLRHVTDGSTVPFDEVSR